MTSDEFRKAVADVKPLKRAKRAVLKAPAPAPIPHQRKRDESAALAESLSGPLTDDETLDEIRRTYEATARVIDPHTAVGVAASRR